MCHKHKNYKNGWQNDRFKFKSKTWNKGTKTIIQRLKSRTWNVWNQSTNNIYCEEVTNINMKRTKQGYGVRL